MTLSNLLFVCLIVIIQIRLGYSTIKLDFIANVVYNKLSQRSLNLPHGRLISIEPRDKVWFTVSNRTLYVLPLFGDYPGPFQLQYRHSHTIDMKIQFEISPSSSLFSPSDHLLLALFNISSINYRNTSFNRYLIVRTLSLALNLTEDLITIHRINGSMIKVYFSCDFFTSMNLTEDIHSLIAHFYSQRVQLISQLPLPLIEISIIRLSKSIRMKTALITIRPRLRNVTMVNPLMLFDQVYQPLVLVPLLIILMGLVICSCIACCLCCHRRSSSSSTLLLPSGRSGSPNNKHLYQNYAYRKYRQQQDISKRRKFSRDQRQFISKGIPVVFAEELEEKLEQTHTPLVMRIERAPFDDH